MLAKTKGLKVDCVAYDLEDSVTPHKKEEARMGVSRFLHEPRPLNITELAVRINPVTSTWAERDLLEVVWQWRYEINPLLVARAHGASSRRRTSIRLSFPK